MFRILTSGLVAAGVMLFAGAGFAQDACDTDYNGDGVTDEADVEMLRQALGSREGDEDFLAQADHDGDGEINAFDYSHLLACN